KYTNLDSFFSTDYAIAPNNTFILPQKRSCKTPLSDAYNIYLENGNLVETDDLAILEKTGVKICSLKEASKKYTEIFSHYYDTKAKDSEHSSVALNTAFLQDGLFIYVPQKTIVEKPIQIINYLHSNTDLFVNSRQLIVVEKHAKVQITDCTHATSTTQFLTNVVSEIFVEENAKAEYYTLQNQSEKSTILMNLFVTQKRDSEVLSNVISLNANKIRNNVSVDLEDENCENHTYGLYLTKGEQHTDNFTAINHIAPHCNSWEHFKGILDDKSTTAFSGRIWVNKDAQKTEAYQTNNNLVLSNDAQANTKPQLIIEADDVSCSHGATVGQLDDIAIFYLRARGIPQEKAQAMMMLAFMNEVAEKIQIDELRERVEGWIADKMENKITYCTCFQNN
ncbi:MAG: Fe-S cluster assembly protein SufD, partial [Flavobacteriaceae bacterium]|nr:Fe-S cluster assembly protein SufD [Flavobacteriaceae bacterium]